MQALRPQETWSIIVRVAAAAAGDFELEVSYVVNRASWTPLYDLRTSSNGDRLNLSYLAEVNQTTGEDWLGVALTLSTAKPGLGTLPPKLDPWYIDAPRQVPLYLPSPAPARASGEWRMKKLSNSANDESEQSFISLNRTIDIFVKFIKKK